MFHRLNKKMQIIISITMIIGIAISVFLAYNSIKSVVYRHYKTLITQHIDQANKNVQLYMNLIEETVEYFSSSVLLHI